MKTYHPAILTAAALVLLGAGAVFSEPIYVPNASFELPSVDFVGTNMVSWETFPSNPDGAIGVFYNNPAYAAYGEYIYNCNGTQAAYIFCDPGLAMFQDYNSVDSSGGQPSHAFNAKFEVGKSYKMLVGLIGGDQGAAPGVIMQMSVYYRDSSNNMVTVAFTNIVYDPSVFTDVTNFVDCELDVPPVAAGNAWAGQNIGIQFLSIVPDGVEPGGDWDLNNVRLTSSIYIPNASFELPQTAFVATNMISWETQPQATDGAIGVFYNNPEYGPGYYIGNCNGNQAAYIFADPGLAMYQDYNSVDSSGGAPSHAFNATYEVGKAYKLVVGLIGGDQGAAPGDIMQMSLYYRNSSNNMVTVASTNIVNNPAVFTSVTNFVDCELNSATVKATDSWAGQNIGIQFLSIIPEDIEPGGDWDLDNVRLCEALTPTLTNPSVINGGFGATVQSDPGIVLQIFGATNLGSAWTNVTTLTNTTGASSFSDTTNGRARYYEAVQISQP